MNHKFITLQLNNTHFVLPWHAQTIMHAIAKNQIHAEELLFSSSFEKQQLSRDLFLLATKDAMTRNVDEPSTLTMMARALMH